jgi:hypothetical protein
VKLPGWVKALGALLLAIGGAVLALWVSARIRGRMPWGILATPGRAGAGEPLRWTRLPGNEREIAVRDGPLGWKAVALPPGVKAQDVTAAALVAGKVHVTKRNAGKEAP